MHKNTFMFLNRGYAIHWKFLFNSNVLVYNQGKLTEMLYFRLSSIHIKEIRGLKIFCDVQNRYFVKSYGLLFSVASSDYPEGKLVSCVYELPTTVNYMLCGLYYSYDYIFEREHCTNHSRFYR